MINNLQAILLIQFDIFKHGEKKWNKIILASTSNNLQAILLIQFDIVKHEEKEWNKIILLSKYCNE